MFDELLKYYNSQAVEFYKKQLNACMFQLWLNKQVYDGKIRRDED